ncbi:MAG: type IV secretion system protein [Rickettsiales bacterium]|nr:type IV secretion system protein [Rickettsiales bacterium]
MNNWNIKKISKIFNFAIFLILLFSFVAKSLYASVGDRVRNGIRYNPNTKLCDKDELKFDPFFTGNPDVNWEISNPVCLTLMATSVLVANTSDYVASKQCNPADASAEVNAALKASFFNPAILMIGLAKNGGMCGSYTSICALNPDPITKAAACQAAARCCGFWAGQIASYGIMVGSFAVVYRVAKDAYEDARICGHNWLGWANNSGVWTKGIFKDSRAFEVSDNIKKTPSYKKIGNKDYREFIYGGVEYEDNGADACKNPAGWSSEARIKYLGYSSENQRYYMKGSKETPSFACYRFLLGIDKISEDRSFECCQERSQNTICIERNGEKYNINTDHRQSYKFCKIGDTKCSLWGNGSNGTKGIEGEVYYNIYESRKNAGYICAETYSVCPYNHPLGGGTEEMSNSSNANGDPNKYNIANFCQYMYHCSKIPNKLYFKTSNLSGSFISQSCRDMKGDSQNNYNSTASIISTNSFSSAIVQCFKETLENAFFNKAGYTKCVDANEEPKGEKCNSGYIQIKGQSITGDSFFVKIQKKLKDAIKILLTLSVMFLGGKIAMGEEINKKLIFGYIAKIAVIIYFVIGDAWQAHFMKGVMDSSSFLAGLMFVSDADIDAKKNADTNKSDNIDFLDGCQFPRYNYLYNSDFNNPKYAPGNEYLKMWDTLDCKIARAIGMAPGATTANLILTILAGFFTGGLGILFVIAVLVFAIFLIHLVIQALHMFLVSILAIIILIFVSPITITMALFDKTKNIFESWLSELLGYAFQPMIIYAYLGIFIALFDSVIVGKGAIFQGDGKEAPKDIICANQDIVNLCKSKNINCDGIDVNADSNSIYCIFGLTKVKNYTGFEALSIGIPQLVGLIDNKLAIITIFKSAFLFIIFSFAGAKIPDLARALVGGSSVDGGNWSSATKSLGQLTSIYSSIRSAQQKGVGLVRKIGSSVNNERRDYRHNLDQYSNKKDQGDSNIQSSQQSKLAGGKSDAVQQIQENNQYAGGEGGKKKLSDDNQNQSKEQEIGGQDQLNVEEQKNNAINDNKSGDNQNQSKEQEIGDQDRLNVEEQKNDTIDGKKEDVKDLLETDQENTNSDISKTQPVVPEVKAVQSNMGQQGQNPQDNQDQSQEQNSQDNQDNANNIGDQPSAELTNNKKEESVLNQGDNQNQLKDKTPVAPKVKTVVPENKTPKVSNNVISNQQQIQSNANQGQKNNIPINNSKPAIQQNNEKAGANKLYISNPKIRVLKDSYLLIHPEQGIKGSNGKRKFLGNIDKGIEKSLESKDFKNIRMQEFAMNASKDQIQALKNNMKIMSKQEKEFNKNMLEAVKSYIGNDYLNKRDVKELAERNGIAEIDAENMMNERYKERLKEFGIKDENLDKILEESKNKYKK